jgi:hypothetical protein
LGKREVDMSQPISVKLLVVFLSGTLIAGCSMSTPQPTPTAIVPTATATFNPTSTLTPTPTVTLTPTVTPTTTLTPIPTSELPGLVATFGLDPEREYLTQEIQGLVYLVNQFNKAKMLRKENGEWVDTSLEEKYGHLAPRDGFLFTPMEGNEFHDDTGAYDPSQHKSVVFSVWSTGNVNLVREFNSDLGMETENIFGDVVFRDKDNVLIKLDVRFDVAIPGQEIKMPVCSPTEKPDDSGFFDGECRLWNLMKLDSIKEELEWYNKPGRQMSLSFNYERPERPPISFPNNINLRSRANYFEWVRNKNEYHALYEDIVRGNNIVIPHGLIIAAAKVGPLMLIEDYLEYYYASEGDN